MIKALKKLGGKGTSTNIIKAITTNGCPTLYTLNDGNVRAFGLKSEMRQACHSLHSFILAFDVLSGVVREEVGIEGYKWEMKKSNYCTYR